MSKQLQATPLLSKKEQREAGMIPLALPKMHLNKIRLNQGGYDKSGKYWGVGVPLWRAWNDDGEETYVRAYSREKAKACFPGVKFYR